MTDLSTLQSTGSTWTPGAISKGKDKTANPSLGMQRQLGNTATGAVVAPKKAPSPEVTSEEATSAFTKLAPVIDLIVPTAGSAGAFTAQLKIPVKGAFVGIHVAATVLRNNDNSIQLGVTANVTAGATMLVATATFELGAYLQVQGRSAREALVIVSWALYRQMAESNAPREVEQAWFGDKKGQTAEQWDALVRKTLFTKESGNWAEVGAQIGTGVKVGIGGVTAQAQAMLRMGRKYDADAIGRREGVQSTTQKLTSALGIDRGSQASLGDRVFSVIGSASFSAKIAQGSIMVTVAVRQIKDKHTPKGTTSYELDKITVTGTASCIGLGTVASAFAGAEAVKNLLDKVTTKTEAATDKAKKELQSQGQNVGGVVQDLDGLRNGLSAASGQLNGLSLTIPGLAATGQIHIMGGYTNSQAYLKIAFEKLTKITVTVGVFSLTAKKIERLASIEYADGKWTAYLGELSKDLVKKAPATSGGKSTTTPSTPGAKGGGGGSTGTGTGTGTGTSTSSGGKATP